MSFLKWESPRIRLRRTRTSLNLTSSRSRQQMESTERKSLRRMKPKENPKLRLLRLRPRRLLRYQKQTQSARKTQATAHLGAVVHPLPPLLQGELDLSSQCLLERTTLLPNLPLGNHPHRDHDSVRPPQSRMQESLPTRPVQHDSEQPPVRL